MSGSWHKTVFYLLHYPLSISYLCSTLSFPRRRRPLRGKERKRVKRINMVRRLREARVILTGRWNQHEIKEFVKCVQRLKDNLDKSLISLLYPATRRETRMGLYYLLKLLSSIIILFFYSHIMSTIFLPA